MNTLKDKHGVAFIVVLVYIVLGLFLIGGFIRMTSREYKITDVTNENIRAFYEAEAGANRGLSELKKRVQSDVVTNLRAVNVSNRQNAVATYVNTGTGSLDFLRQYACVANGTQFTVSGNEAKLNIPIVTGFNYSGEIIVTKNGNPTYDDINDRYTFPYQYNIYGQVTTETATKKVFLSEAFNITVFPQTFASYALFTNRQKTASGSNVWFIDSTNFSGPVHTNGRFNFALNPSGTFTGLVAQAQQTAYFYNNGMPVLLDADSNGDRDVPTFQAGFNRGVDNIPMPTAVARDTQRRRALGLSDGDAIPNYANGIYVTNNGTNVTGGIYVQGNSTITMGTSDNNATYTITEGGTTQNITVDYTNNQTTVQTVGGDTNTYNGTLNGMIFVNDGSITSLSGTVQKDSQVTVAATNDVIFTNHLQYEEFTAGDPPNAEGRTNVLGVMSWNGNVRIGTACPDNLNLHATVMAPNGEFTVDNYRSRQDSGICTVLGGVITNTYGAFGTFSQWGGRTGFGRNFVYDTRMGQGVSPPFFPTLPNFDAGEDGLDNEPVWNEV